MEHVEKIYTMCRRYCDCDERAKDYTQECFLEVFINLKKFDPNKGELAGWIYVVSRNHVLKLIKKEKRLGLYHADDLSYIPDDVVEEEDVKIEPERLIAEIQDLPDGYRNVLNLYVFEGKSHKEIGRILGISSSTSRSQFSRAKNLLKARLIQCKIHAKRQS
jgi:RNA polymerase sigma-70 factor (ECF subfamily)